MAHGRGELLRSVFPAHVCEEILATSRAAANIMGSMMGCIPIKIQSPKITRNPDQFCGIRWIITRMVWNPPILMGTWSVNGDFPLQWPFLKYGTNAIMGFDGLHWSKVGFRSHIGGWSSIYSPGSTHDVWIPMAWDDHTLFTRLIWWQFPVYSYDCWLKPTYLP
jgi:hypothetical protein